MSAPSNPSKIRRASLDGPNPMTRSWIELSRSARTVLVSAGTSSGAVSRSLTSRMDPDVTPSRLSMPRARSRAVEMRVPARNVCVQGFTGGPSSGGTSSLRIGRSSFAGVPGGSSS